MESFAVATVTYGTGWLGGSGKSELRLIDSNAVLRVPWAGAASGAYRILGPRLTGTVHVWSGLRKEIHNSDSIATTCGT
jgi:hypothetical protein